MKSFTAGANENDLVDRSLLHVRADHVGGNHGVTGLGHEVRGFHHAFLAFRLDLLLAFRQA